MRKDVTISIGIFIVLSLIYLTTSKTYLGGGDLRYSVATAKAVLNDHSLNIDDNTYSYLHLKKEHTQDGIGWYYYNAKKDKSYSRYGIGTPIVLLPFVYLGQVTSSFLNMPVDDSINVFISVYNAFYGAGIAVMVYLICRFFRSSARVALITSVIIALSTMLWCYGSISANEASQTFFLLLAVYLFMLNTRLSILAGSCSLAFLILMKVYFVVFVPVFFLFLWVNSEKEKNDILKKCFLLLVPVFICGAIILSVNYIRFGDPVDIGAGGGPGHRIYFGIKGMADHLVRLLVSRNKGLFVYNPVLLLTVMGLIPLWKKYRREVLFFLSITVIHFLLISSYSDWHGDWGWGPRYLVPIIPLLGIPVSALLSSGKRYIKPLVLTFFIASTFVQVLSVGADPSEYHWIRYRLRYASDIKSDHTRTFPVDLAGIFLVLRHKAFNGDNVYSLSQFGDFSEFKVDTSEKGFKRWDFFWYHLAQRFDLRQFLLFPIFMLAGALILLYRLFRLTIPDAGSP